MLWDVKSIPLMCTHLNSSWSTDEGCRLDKQLFCHLFCCDMHLCECGEIDLFIDCVLYVAPILNRLVFRA